MCKASGLPSLKHVQMYCSDAGKEMQVLAKSSLLSHLKVLDLTHGCMTDEGASILAEADLSSLEKLDLSYNYLSQTGIDALRATGVHLVAEGNNGGNPSEDLEYLWHGDME